MTTWIMAVVTAGFLIMAAYILNSQAPEAAAALNEAIKLASAVVGFGVAVYGGVKAFLGLNKSEFTTLVAQEVGTAGLTSAAGAVLVLASQL